MMNAAIRVLGVLSVLCLVVAVAAPALAADDPQTGKVKSASDTQIVVTMGDADMTFKVDAATTVTLDGKEAKVTDLKAGDSVKVTSKQAEGANKLATKIEATRA